MLSKWVWILTATLCSVSLLGFSEQQGKEEMKPAEQKHPVVLIKTNKGIIKAELDAEKAPKTVANFLKYANDGFYDLTIFHRVINNFMIQGGGFTIAMKQKPASAPIAIESDNGLKNLRGTLAMARTSDPNSATAQFFINLKDNDFLDYKSKTPSGYGYAVFGKVTEGMNIVDEIAKAQTGHAGPHADVPVDPIVIENVQVLK